MKEKLKNKKVVYTIIGIVSVLLVALAVTYAYWLVTKTQANVNVISSACLDISLSGEKNDIELTNQFPMSDEDGMKLVPYEFTVTNNCNTSVDYQVALEATGTESNAMATSSIKVALNDSVTLLSSNTEVDTTIDGAYESRRLMMGTLATSGNEGSTATYELRIWIDEDAPISEMNKTFTSKISVTIGQGIFNPYKEGTLSYSILTNVGGTGATSELDATEFAHRITATGDSYVSTSSNYYYGTEYTFDVETKKYKLSGTLTQATTSECRSGTKTCGKYTLKNTSSTYESLTLYEVTDFQSSGNYVTANAISYKSTFEAVTTANDAGLYKTQDDLGISYYYRGNVKNNYVQFGATGVEYELCFDEYLDTDPETGEDIYDRVCYEKFLTLEECELEKEENHYGINKTCEVTTGSPMYWRIVRINGDGTIRLVYDGTKIQKNDSCHYYDLTSRFNQNYNELKYSGYTYDTSETDTTQIDSTIKGVVDTWYDTHLETNYGKFIEDGIFCNDRSGKTQDEEGYIYDGGGTYYASYVRLRINTKPVLTCANKEDRYTVDDTINGNGLLSNPVGLITADEVVFAGNSTVTANDTTYLGNLCGGSAYWTLTPSGNRNAASVWHVDEMGHVYEDSYYGSYDVNSTLGVRPVINLKADVEFTGDGTIDNPYKIVTE